MTELVKCPGKRTFKLTADEVKDIILSCLDINHKSEVLEIDLPEKGDPTISVELSFGLFLDEANRIADAFDDEKREMLIFSIDEDDRIIIILHPGDKFWNKEGGNQ